MPDLHVSGLIIRDDDEDYDQEFSFASEGEEAYFSYWEWMEENAKKGLFTMSIADQIQSLGTLDSMIGSNLSFHLMSKYNLGTLRVTPWWLTTTL